MNGGVSFNSHTRVQICLTQMRVARLATPRCRPVIHLLHLIEKQTCVALGLTLMAAAELRINAIRVV